MEIEIPEGYKKTQVGVIPVDWEIQSVSQAFEIFNNLRYPISEEVRKKQAGDYPYYGPTKVQGYINEYRVEGEYALIGEDGDHFLKWRESPMTLLVKGKFNVNNHAHIVKGTKNLTQWFYYYFYHRDITPHLTRQGAGRYKLTKNSLLQILCAIPPTTKEQEAIAQALSDVDAAIAELDRLITKKRNIKQGATQQLLTGKKRLPSFSGEWGVQKLGSCLIKNPEYGINAPAVPYSDNLPVYIRITDISEDGRFLPEKKVSVNHPLSANYVLEANDLVLARTGASTGKSYLSNSKDGELVFAGFLIRVKVNPEKLDAQYLKGFLQTKAYWNWVGAMSMRSGQPGINGNEYAQLPIPLPPTLEEQKAIAQVLSDMDAEIEALEQKRNKYKAIKQGMMQELLTGRTRLV
ncbi:restriction endonuclease subunit S [Microcoleus sp. FACHB-831]|uniref:restriction endonuclease subunit S n=1 Tax=Microcoleus sp. FACHB-831 TaxID=2692827 RepID=UPI0016828C39|nr:restriction endonuclease subunit S [Microcoleus sp. FACHB-831]